MGEPGFSIASVERDTGLSKDVLRVWERRYGFPVPGRDEHGERVYPAEQVERLRLIKRLMDQGHRPGKLLAAPVDALAALAPRRRPAAGGGVPAAELESLLALIGANDGRGYVAALRQRMAREGLFRFVQDIVGPLAGEVGLAWERGRFQVFEEHLFTELTARVLRQAIGDLPRGAGTPRVLLTSVPDEEHELGLLMVEALLALEGAECIALGTQLPLADIGRAAQAHHADIVALSFSAAFPARQVPALLKQLRGLLPGHSALWVGGAGVARVAVPDGVRAFQALEQTVEALAQWRCAPAAPA